ncbi:MAG: hypothetical protein EAZ65_09470 [Verrucomicrobia bacterium]|nr:MAG: hypothetical protein EAZ84_12300 [Verrucomicrobiota bacterium]TAE86282.1 MAG: hypothetical protein EAZ82_11515 [Verrucomicrobiota bacterium]TAF23050.1 MAG: hypothetical protein EAZ71_13245 [Verrucomicrobiota bacterium]TAF39941.1 MAG: hypothetical protein EAZ65_09470 [Verrucomicrobiota bacterium]
MGIGVLVMGGGYLWLRSWLHGAEFRRMLAAEADKALGVVSEFGEFRWGGARMETSAFQASGEKVVRAVDAEELAVDVGLGGWWKGLWRIDEARVRRIEVELDVSGAGAAVAEESEDVQASSVLGGARSGAWYDRLVPREVALGRLEVGSSFLNLRTKGGPVSVRGTAWQVTPDQAQGSYRAEGSGGTLRLPWKWAPPMSMGKARLQYQGDEVFLTSADFQLYQSGRLELSGEMSVGSGAYGFDGDLRDVMCAEILPEDWRQRLSGKVEADFSVDRGERGPRVKGEVALLDGVLTAMPLLDSLSAYADTTRFRRLALEEGRTDFEWEDGALVLRDVRIASEGLVRLEGGLRIDRDKRLDGRFRLGLVPGVLARIPGAETVVFTPGERGLLWTTLRIGGTLEDPEEDLSGRLIAAAGLRMFEVLPESGERVLKFTREVIGGDLREQLENGGGVIEEGREVIREAEGVVREVKGIFDILQGEEAVPEDE